jgi:hypothetical protein
LASTAAAQPAPVDPQFADGLENGIVAFRPNETRVLAGASNASTAPTPLTLVLSEPVASDTFIAIASSDPGRLTVVGGGVTVLAGQSTAVVRVDAAANGQAAAPVILSATRGVRRAAGVRVEGVLNETNVAGEADFCNAQFPLAFTVSTGATTPAIYGRLFELGVTEPAGAPPGWYAEVGYARTGSDPRVLAGWTFIPASYNLQVSNDDEFQASFAAPGLRGVYDYAYRFSSDSGANYTYCDLNGAGSNPGGTFEPSSLGVMTTTGGLVINEIDYDQPVADNAEFVEIFNTGSGPISLADKRLVLVNGSGNTTYLSIDLSAAGTLPGGQYLVVANASVATPPGVPRIDFASALDNIQNGAPDAVALVDTLAGVLIDALSYEGSVTTADIAGVGVVSLVEGTALPLGVADNNATTASLVRLPNGADSDNAAADWSLSALPTPGSANGP